jgi:hypothetical protein
MCQSDQGTTISNYKYDTDEKGLTLNPDVKDG